MTKREDTFKYAVRINNGPTSYIVAANVADARKRYAEKRNVPVEQVSARRVY